MKTIGIATLALLLLAARSASAEESTQDMKKRGGVGGDAAFVLPVGRLFDGASVGVGALGKFEYTLPPPVTVTARVGFVYHFSKDFGGTSVGISTIPIWVGGKVHPLGTKEGPYGALELGPTVILARAGNASDSETRFSMTVGGGYQVGPIDIRAGLWVYDLGHFGDSLSLSVNVGYTAQIF
jgi:hypothetical protein